ncbi:Amidohydrolase [Desulfovibrionales bacterium]
MTLYLKNVNWLDLDATTLASGHLAVEEGPRGSLVFLPDFPVMAELEPDDRVLDCHGQLVTRAFACGHHHIYSALARGMPPAPSIPRNFTEILKFIWWRLDKCLDLEMIEASALATALACAKHGVTYVIDHHSSPLAVKGSLTIIARAFERIGLGHLLCYEISCRDGAGPMEAGLVETDTYLQSGRKGHIGLHASFTVDNDLLRRAVQFARRHRTGIHIHVAEDLADQKHCLATYGTRVVHRLAEAGVLDLQHTILSHCIHCDMSERELIRNSPAWVVQNTESNQNNGVGLTGYAEFGPRVMFGTDGMHSDMLRSARASYLAGQTLESLSPASVYARFRAVHSYIAALDTSGDGPNNLVVLDYDTPTDLTPDNFFSHFVYGLEAGHVQTVIAQGRVIVEEGRLATEDEEDILLYAKEQARRLWAKLRETN